MKVTAAIFRNGDNVLLMRRGADQPLAGEWEYPGGKFEDGEELKGYVDYDEGVIKGSFRDNKGESYTKKNADGFKIPLLKEAIKLAKECAEATPDVREVEWNFCISSKKVYLMNANLWEDVMFLQTPEYLVRRNGILPRYKDMMFEIRG